MAYIGRAVNYGNLSTDNFTGNNGASYTLTYNTTTDGVVISLDGVVQVNGTDFNIVGPALTFTSNVATGVKINIIYLGLTVSVGVPGDSTITNSKIVDVAGTKLTGTVIAKGDGSSTDGKITLNCSQNTHGVSIQSPAHVTNSSYTLTLPTTDGNANELLKTDGGGVLSWAVDSGGGPSLGANHIIRTNSTEINENITFPASAPFVNGSSVGPITITGSYTVTIPAGNTYTII